MNGRHLRRAALAACLGLVATTGVGACGEDGSSAADNTVVVSAATSLKKALTTYHDGFDTATVRASFAGSDQLGAQIREGVRPDVFASANTTLPSALFDEGLVERPVVFATNELVLAVPAGGAEAPVQAISDLATPGRKIAIGASGVPVGDYTRRVLAKLPATQRMAILHNVRSNEPDVGGVVGKITQGAVDAGFVYASDVSGAGGAIRAIPLPSDLGPTVRYAVAIVKDAKHHEAATAYVEGLVSGAGADALRANGFGPAP